MSWRKFPIRLSELCIDTTLRCGQSFRWKKSAVDGSYSCALNGRLISLNQDATHLHYRTISSGQSARNLPPSSKSKGARSVNVKEEDDEDWEETVDFLQHYLNLKPDLGALYEEWSCADTNFKKKAPKFTGVRILRQDAWESLVGFICSSNNNIARISQMMDKLCINYGSLVGHIDSHPFYDMPKPAALTDPKVEGHLRELGFGYRAKYLYQTAVKIMQEQEGWLDSLRNPESPLQGQKSTTEDEGELLPGGREGYRHAHEQLLGLQGVGPKVADCVCLMGLGWGEAVPVDTHVWQIAQRDYKFGKGKHRSLTKATYDAVADHFRGLWGKEAGWAHSVLFTADLKAFSERLTAKVEVKEEIKSETDDEEQDTKRLVRATRVSIDVTPALTIKGEDETRTLIKSERVSTSVGPFGVREAETTPDIKDEMDVDSKSGVVKTEDRAIKEDSEAIPSIELDRSLPREGNVRVPLKSESLNVKQDNRKPIKQESMDTENLRGLSIAKSEIRSVKKEQRTQARRIKAETSRQGSLFAANDGRPPGVTNFEADMRNLIRGERPVTDAAIALAAEAITGTGYKREAEEDTKRDIRTADIPGRRTSKRQRRM